MRRIITRVLDGELVLATATADTADGPFMAAACAFTEQDAVTSASMACLSRSRSAFRNTRGMKEVTSMSNATEELAAFDWDLGGTAEDEREYPVLLSNVY